MRSGDSRGKKINECVQTVVVCSADSMYHSTFVVYLVCRAVLFIVVTHLATI